MDGQWQQHNSDVHAEHDLAMASPGDFNLLLQDLGDDFDGLLELELNTIMNNTDDASAAAAADQDNNSEEVKSNRKRHRRDQIQELEAAYLVNQHPDDQERVNLGMRIGMAGPQVKFWFQNRRSAQRNTDKKQELTQLKEENQALQAESRDLRLATENRACLTCRGAGERQHLLSENERLKEKLRRANAFLARVSGGRAEAMPVAMPCGSHGPATNHNVVVGADKGKAVVTDDAPPHRPLAGPMVSANEGPARSQRDTNGMLIDIASRASNEFRALVYSGSPMWMPAPDGEVELLNFQTYVDTMFPSIFGPYRTAGCIVDGTRKGGDVMCTADNLVDVLMDAARWSEIFPGVVVSASASHIVTPTTASRHEMIIVMDAVLRVVSPRMPVRRVKFLRQCRKVEPGIWAVVDWSVDGILGEDGGGEPPEHKARFLPSGCLIEERNNSCCKVTWIVNMEYELGTLPTSYHEFLRSGQALGARRWLSSLQRQCDYLAVLHSYTNNDGDMTPNGRMNIFDVAQRMTRSFYLAVCGPWRQPWSSLGEWDGACGIDTERFKVVARVVTMEQAGAVVLNVIAPVRFPGIPPQQVFDYLCDLNRRGEWDAPVLREGCYPTTTAQLPGNAVSVLRTITPEVTNSKLILQETCADTSCMVLAYATLDEQYMMQHAMNNGGPASLPLLPSGVVILPDCEPPVTAACSSSTAVGHGSGSLVAVMYQKLLNGQPPEVPSHVDIDNAGNLLCRVIRKIKDAVHANILEAA